MGVYTVNIFCLPYLSSYVFSLIFQTIVSIWRKYCCFVKCTMQVKRGHNAYENCKGPDPMVHLGLRCLPCHLHHTEREREREREKDRQGQETERDRERERQTDRDKKKKVTCSVCISEQPNGPFGWDYFWSSFYVVDKQLYSSYRWSVRRCDVCMI